jgi:hypothetical protein
MRALLLATILLARTTGGAPGGGLPSGAETPSAADLLRAKRMAEEASRRLQVRPPKRGTWVSGGGGWTPSSKAPSASPEGGLPTRRRVR